MQPSGVTQILAEYGALTRSKLETYVEEAANTPHLYDLLMDYPARGGKMMRPSLCIATAAAYGVHPEIALNSAVAIELLHNGILIHDDLEDGSEMRRGIAAFHVTHGAPIAINTGDMLLLLGLRPLIDNFAVLGPELATAILRETERTSWAVARGQAIELDWCQQNQFQLKDKDYLDMVFKKTSWLGMVYPTRIGALIGSRGRAHLEKFVRFGFFLGAAFQIQDDMLNLSADSRYGKERFGDLYEGKRTLILLHTWRNCSGAERRKLKHVLNGPRAERSAGAVEWMMGLIERHGSIEYARRIADAMAGAALFEFNNAYGELPDSRDKEFIHSLVRWVFQQHD